MNHEEKLARSMQKAVIAFMQKYLGILEVNSNLGLTYNMFLATDAKLDEAIIIQNTVNKSGHITFKNVKFEELGLKCFKLSRKVLFFARTTGNTMLDEEINQPESAYKNESKENFFGSCSKLLIRSRQNIDRLKEFGVVESELQALEALYVEVEQLPSVITTVSNEQKAARMHIKQHLAESKRLLGILDVGFEGLISDEEFLEGWFEARKLKGHRGTKKQDKPDSPQA